MGTVRISLLPRLPVITISLIATIVLCGNVMIHESMAVA